MRIKGGKEEGEEDGTEGAKRKRKGRKVGGKESKDMRNEMSEVRKGNIKSKLWKK